MHWDEMRRKLIRNGTAGKHIIPQGYHGVSTYIPGSHYSLPRKIPVAKVTIGVDRGPSPLLALTKMQHILDKELSSFSIFHDFWKAQSGANTQQGNLKPMLNQS